MRYVSHSYEDTIRFAETFAKKLEKNTIILLLGDLGAGKTCFVNGLLSGLGFAPGGCSPTFTIVNEYPSQPPVNHFDLYRIGSEEELYEMGFPEYLDNGRITVIEWPQIAAPILQKFPRIQIEIRQTDQENERIITIEHLYPSGC